MEKIKKIVSPFRLSSLLRLQTDPNLALQLFLNPNPVPDPNSDPDPKPKPKPFRYTLLSYDLIITKLGRAKMFDQMERVLDMLKHETRFVPTEIIFCNIITLYARAHLPDRAFVVFDSIPSFGCQRTIKSANTLLNTLLKCREYEKMREFFVGIGKYADPDACTYNIFINASCSGGDLGGALNVFDEMWKRGIWPNEVTFVTLINALCVNSKLGEAMRLKEAMFRVFKVKPNSFVYASLIKGLCKVNELGRAFELKDEMLRRRVKVGPAVYTSLISGLFKAGRRGDAIVVLEEMKRNGCKPDTVTYNAMICGFCHEKDFDAAFDFLDKMEDKGCKPDVITYNIIIKGLCREGNLQKAIDLFKDMPTRKCVPDILMYRILFDGFCDGMQLKKAALVLDEMVSKGYAPRSESLMEFIGRLCHVGDLELLRTVPSTLEKGNLNDVAMWKMVVPLVCQNDELSRGLELVRTLIMPSTNASSKACLF